MYFNKCYLLLYFHFDKYSALLLIMLITAEKLQCVVLQHSVFFSASFSESFIGVFSIVYATNLRDALSFYRQLLLLGASTFLKGCSHSGIFIITSFL